MKTFLRLTALTLLFGFNFATQSAMAANGSEKVFSRQTIEGTEAQFILESLLELKAVRGLEDIGECDLDLCTAEVQFVKCEKGLFEAAGSLEEKIVGLACAIQPPKKESRAIQVLHDENPGVSKLRRALIEKTRRLRHTSDSNSVTVDSISCTATGIGRHELDTFRTEPTYKCDLQY